MFRIKATCNDEYGDSFSFPFDLNNNYEEISIKGLTSDTPLFVDKIEKYEDNSLQLIDITDEIECSGALELLEKEYFKNFVENIKIFSVLREIKITLTEYNYHKSFDSGELEILIKNLSTLKLLEEIKIKIHNPNIKLSKKSSKLFNKMTIEKENNYLVLSWKYE